MQLSKLENMAYLEIEKNGFRVFKIKDLCLLISIKKAKAYNLVKALKKKGVIKSVGNGFFAKYDADEFVVGQSMHYPSYISFWSALTYYGFSDHMQKKIFYATTKYTKEIGNFKYVTLSKDKFFGYTAVGNLTIAEKEKAVIDGLLFPKYAGGIDEIIKCVKAAGSQLDIKKLISYSKRVKNKAVLRRLGFILEMLGHTEKYVTGIRKNIGGGYELLDPSLGRMGKLNMRWLLYINN